MVRVNRKQIDLAKKNKDKYDMDLFFGKDWLNQQLNPGDNPHPIFWVMCEKDMCFKLLKDLSVLKSKRFKKYDKIINRLKNDEKSFNSTLTEIEVLAYYCEKFGASSVDYEPKIDGVKKHPDIKLIIDGKECYIEIATSFNDELEKNSGDIKSQIQDCINKIDQPYIISFGIEYYFQEEDITDFLRFFKILLEDKKGIKRNHEYVFKKGGISLGRINFGENVNKGFVASISSGIRTLNSIGRIKNRILSKIDKGQLPDGKNNFILIHLVDIYSDSTYGEVENAFLGERVYDIENDQTLVKKNGIIHDSRSKNISGLIVYKHGFENRKIFENPNANNLPSQQLINKL